MVVRDTDRVETQFDTWSTVIRTISQIVLLLKKWRNRSILLSGKLLIFYFAKISFHQTEWYL
jgi:hypothetical protein